MSQFKSSPTINCDTRLISNTRDEVCNTKNMTGYTSIYTSRVVMSLHRQQNIHHIKQKYLLCTIWITPLRFSSFYLENGKWKTLWLIPKSWSIRHTANMRIGRYSRLNWLHLFVEVLREWGEPDRVQLGFGVGGL